MAVGLTITYVTDHALDEKRQRNVIRQLISAADEHNLRVAVRLPNATDEAVADLVDWYLNESEGKRLLPALIHNRPEFVKASPQVRSWLPSRLLGSGATADVWSVHSFDEASQVSSLGAGEVVFGPVFHTASHPGESGRGLGPLQEIGMIPGITVTAIGGINEQWIGAISVNSVACIRAISESPDIANTLNLMSNNWKGKPS